MGRKFKGQKVKAVSIYQEIYDQLKEHCESNGMTMTFYVSKILKEFIDKKEEEKHD